jgi:acetyl-CoA C-acetyltransferase/acetyl-CoA acyltransferase
MFDIAIVGGVRTPFVKAFGPLAPLAAYDLGRANVVALLEKSGVRADQVDQAVIGNVAVPAEAANIARVIALQAGMPQNCIAHTVHRNCASGMEAITQAAQLVQLGDARLVLAGGAESMSQIPLLYNEEATEHFWKLSRARSWWQRVKTLAGFRLRHFRPDPALKLGLTDPVSGLIMGATAEVLVDEFGISRQAQDEYALLSHQRAVAAQERCVLSEEIVPLILGEGGATCRTALQSRPLDPDGSGEPSYKGNESVGEVLPDETEVAKDIGPRAEQSLEALGRMRPFFKQGGSVTVGNSCSITDGAAMVLVMSGEQARAEGRQPLGYLRAWSYAGLDPRRMGLGPAFATAKLFAKTGLSMKDIDLVEMNEAFAAQVIANERAFASTEFAEKELGRSEALGELDRERMNVNGGAIALGHPIAATGARLVITLLKELQRRGKKRGLATLCIGGGQGAALLLEAP